jgi:hypothetical protein
MYAATLTPALGITLPFAVARVTPTRIEAGYLMGDKVILLPPPENQRLRYWLVEVGAQGPRLTIVTADLGSGKKLTLTWEWKDGAYRLPGTESR